jgi:hypothetical protein
LDQSVRAANRGLEDLVGDIGYAADGTPTGTQSVRAEDDYSIARNDVTQQRDMTLADLLTGHNRETQDYGQAGQNLNRQYGILGDGGFAAQAAAKRAGNQQLARSALDQAHGRSVADYLTQVDPTTGRVVTAADQQLGRLGLDYKRGVEDRGTTLSRAQREGRFYQQDVTESKFAGAKAAGWVPPQRPGYEHRQNGVTYRDAPGGKAVLPNGQVISPQRLRQLLRRFRTHAGAGGAIGQ